MTEFDDITERRPHGGTTQPGRVPGHSLKGPPMKIANFLLFLPLCVVATCMEGGTAHAGTPVPSSVERPADQAADLYHHDAGLLIHQLHLVRGEARRDLQHQLASVAVGWQQALLWARRSGRENDVPMTCTVLEALPKRVVDRAGRGRDPFNLCGDLDVDSDLEVDLYDDQTALLKEVYAWVR